jgi:cyclophilin family peptidyl-prolyl cis-trans isomerase
MRLFAKLRSARPAAVVRAASSRAVEMLESRTLLTATLTNAIATVSVDPSSAPTMIDLSQHFAAGSLVAVNTDQGTFDIALFDQQTPQTVANFLKYVTGGLYNGTIIHRSIVTPTPFVIQGGGFTPNGTHIATPFPSPVNEPGIHNTVGTVAMAKVSGQVNSATSEWFVNLGDNSSNLDNQNGGFTVFGQVVGNGMQVVNAIAALPTVNDSVQSGAWTDLPTHGYTGPNPVVSTVPAANMVNVPTIAQLSNTLTFTTTSDNSALVNPSISGSGLTLTYGAGFGTAHITVAATDSTGASASTTFAVSVGGVSVPVGTGGAKMLRFTDADGTLTTVMLNGPGTASVEVGGTGATAATVHGRTTVTGTGLHIVSISTTGTTSASTLTITGHGGNNVVNVGGLTTDAALRSLNAHNTDLAGNTTINGGVGSVNILSGSSGTLSSTAIGHMIVKNAFAENVSASSIGTFTAGSITGGTWNVSGNVGSVTAGSISNWTANVGTLGKLTTKSTLANSVVHSAGNVGTVAASTIMGSTIMAGVVGVPVGTVPPAVTGGSAATLSTVHTKAFSNSNIAAETLGRLTLGTVTTANAGTTFGVTGHTIQALTATSAGKTLRLKNVTTAAEVAAALTASGFAPGDLQVLIVT